MSTARSGSMGGVRNENPWIDFALKTVEPPETPLRRQSVAECTFTLFKDFVISFLPFINCYQAFKRGNEALETFKAEKAGTKVEDRTGAEIAWSALAITLITIGATLVTAAILRGNTPMLGDLVDAGRSTIGLGLFILAANAIYVRHVRHSGVLALLCKSRSKSADPTPTPGAAPSQSDERKS